MRAMGVIRSITTVSRAVLALPVSAQSSAELRVRQSPIEFVQSDAPINPGKLGGALIDVAGRVTGVAVRAVLAAWLVKPARGGQRLLLRFRA